MPRKKKQDGQAAPGKSNAFDPKHVRFAVESIESLKADIATVMAEALNECRSIHQQIKHVYQDAKGEHGIPKKALKSVIKARELERKAQAVREDLEDDVQDEHDMLRHALGDLADLPLGRAALGEPADVASTGL
jgi:uncharacterized protein (UPF0335 family)